MTKIFITIVLVISILGCKPIKESQVEALKTDVVKALQERDKAIASLAIAVKELQLKTADKNKKVNAK